MFERSATFDNLLDAAFQQRRVDTPVIPTNSVDITCAPAEPATRSETLDLDQTARHCIELEGKRFWVEGDNVLCSCPDCQAPMTIRIWLGLADCWRCGCSTELTKEQLEAVQDLVEQVTTPAPAPVRQRTQLPFQDPSPNLPTVTTPSSLPDSREQELHDLTSGSAAARILRRAFTMTPAWLISFLVHLILILILALIVLNQTNMLPSIVLSTFVDSERKQGGEIRIVDPTDQLVDDLLEAPNMEMSEEEIRDVVEKAESDAAELQKDVAPRESVSELKKNITTRRGPLSSFAARDPRVRTEIVRKEGGTTLTEAAVARGLRWLASVQNEDGSWSLEDYGRDRKGDVAATSLALLPFLGAGQTHESGIYRDTVAKGLSWLINNQETKSEKYRGAMVKGLIGNHAMYAHGQATIVLSEALALTGDQSLAEPTQMAIDFIQRAQHKQGGWRYRPGEPGDTSVLGWQVMALQSARGPNIGIEVDEDVLKLADYYLDNAAAPKSWIRGNDYPVPVGSLYCYLPQQDEPTYTMTAEAILCRMYLGWERDDPRVMGAVSWLLKYHPPSKDQRNIYYWYYATQVFHHYGGRPWDKWNAKMRDLLVQMQQKRGKYPGSWNPQQFKWGGKGERIYVTSLAICTLEVYYRHLPLFAPIEFE